MFRPSRRLLAILALAAVAGCSVRETGLSTAATPSDASAAEPRAPSAPSARPADPSTAAADAAAATTPATTGVPEPPAPSDASASTAAADLGVPTPDLATPPDAAPGRQDAASPLDVAPADASPETTRDATPAVPVPRRALLLTSVQTTEAGDLAVRERLTTLGFRVAVAVVRNAETARAARQSAAEHDLVYLSSTFNTGAGDATVFADLAVPLVCAEYAAFDDLSMVADDRFPSSGVDVRQRVELSRQPHPLRAGRSGTVVVTPSPRTVTWGRPLASAQVIATVADAPDRALIFAYDAGVRLARRLAPARRLGWFGHVDAAATLTDAGWALFDAAIAWAADTTPGAQAR